MHQQAISSTTQLFLDIYDIASDLVITKKGATSIILTVTAMNFDLLAEPEQDAMIYGYAGLLNSLNYPIQILIRSQTKDVSTYLNTLKVKEDATLNRMKKNQLQAYREFVADLIQERNVLDKKFYVVIPATALELGLVSAQSVVPGVKSQEMSSFDLNFIVERAKNLLEPKRDHLISQFARIGLSTTQLKTQEIIQLFYVMYNSESAEGQKMSDSRNYTMPLVEGRMEESIFGTPNRHLVAQHLEEARMSSQPSEIVEDNPSGASPNNVGGQSAMAQNTLYSPATQTTQSVQGSQDFQGAQGAQGAQTTQTTQSAQGAQAGNSAQEIRATQGAGQLPTTQTSVFPSGSQATSPPLVPEDSLPPVAEIV